MTDSKLTDDQRKIVDEVGDGVERAFDEAREQLRTARIPDGEGSTRCFRCSCPGYVFPVAGALAACDRNGCGHPFSRHDVY